MVRAAVGLVVRVVKEQWVDNGEWIAVNALAAVIARAAMID